MLSINEAIYQELRPDTIKSEPNITFEWQNINICCLLTEVSETNWSVYNFSYNMLLVLNENHCLLANYEY